MTSANDKAREVLKGLVSDEYLDDPLKFSLLLAYILQFLEEHVEIDIKKTVHVSYRRVFLPEGLEGMEEDYTFIDRLNESGKDVYETFASYLSVDDGNDWKFGLSRIIGESNHDQEFAFACTFNETNPSRPIHCFNSDYHASPELAFINAIKHVLEEHPPNDFIDQFVDEIVKRGEKRDARSGQVPMDDVFNTVLKVVIDDDD